MRHLTDDPLPDGVFSPEAVAISQYAHASTTMRLIIDELYAELSRHFDTKQMMELWATVGLSNQVNRFHATFLTDVDDAFMAALAQAARCRSRRNRPGKRETNDGLVAAPMRPSRGCPEW